MLMVVSVFGDGYSRGTANMIQAARQEGLLLDVFIYPKQKEEDHV